MTTAIIIPNHQRHMTRESKQWVFGYWVSLWQGGEKRRCMKLFVPFIMSDFLHGYETVDLTANRLENGQGVEVNIAITGESGSGKSSFINTIRE